MANNRILQYRYFSLFCILVGFLLSTSNGHAQGILDQKTDIIVNGLNATETLLILREAAEINIVFDPTIFDPNKLISLHEIDVPISHILDKLLKDIPVEYVEKKDKILVRNQSFEPFTLNGYIKSKSSGEAIVGAKIHNKNSDKITYSNDFGFYSIDVIARESDLIVSFPGYKDMQEEIDVLESRLDFELDEIRFAAYESFSADSATQTKKTQYSISKLGISKTLGRIVEPDTHYDNEISGRNLSNTEPISPNQFWGGKDYQNITFLDGIRLFMPKHLYGYVSGISPRILKSNKLFQQNIPSQFSGGLSSVVDLKTKDGSMKEWGINAGINSQMGNLTVDLPLIKDKASILVSYRGNFSDPWRQKHIKKASIYDTDNDFTSLNFSDLFLKARFKLKKKHTLNLSHYRTTDKMEHKGINNSIDSFGPFDEQVVLQNNDTLNANQEVEISSLRWQYHANDKLILSSIFSYSQYQNDNYFMHASSGVTASNDDVFSGRLVNSRSTMEQMEAQMFIDYFHNTKHYFQFGLQVDQRKFSPEILVRNLALGENMFNTYPSFRDSIYDENTEIRVYFQDQWKMDKMELNLGISLGSLAVKDLNYFNTEPRIGMIYRFSDNTALSLNLMINKQPFQQLNNATAILPSNIVVSSNFSTVPQTSQQISLGLKQKFKERYTLELTPYYKVLKGVNRFEDNTYNLAMANITARNWDDVVDFDEHEISGLDFILLSDFDKWQGNFRYSHSRSAIKDVSPLTSSITATNLTSNVGTFGITYFLGKNLTLNGNWVYKVGQNIEALTAINDFNQIYSNGSGLLNLYDFEISTPDQIKLDDYHRLDLGLNFIIQTEKSQHELSLNIFNAYNNNNQSFLAGLADSEEDLYYIVKGIGFMPSFGYQYNFRQKTEVLVDDF